jgi:hypothetical protein
MSGLHSRDRPATNPADFSASLIETPGLPHTLTVLGKAAGDYRVRDVKLVRAPQQNGSRLARAALQHVNYFDGEAPVAVDDLDMPITVLRRIFLVFERPFPDKIRMRVLDLYTVHSLGVALSSSDDKPPRLFLLVMHPIVLPGAVGPACRTAYRTAIPTIWHCQNPQMIDQSPIAD